MRKVVRDVRAVDPPEEQGSCLLLLFLLFFGRPLKWGCSQAARWDGVAEQVVAC